MSFRRHSEVAGKTGPRECELLERATECGKGEVGSTSWRFGRPTDNVRRERIVIRIDNQGFFRVDVPLTHRGRSKVVTARGREHCPPSGFKGVYPGSRVGSRIWEVGNINIRRTECEGVKGKAKSDTRMSGQGAVPFEVFGLHFPLVA